MHLIAYNLIRALMCEAALSAHVPLERVSFTSTRDAAYHYSQAIARIPANQAKRRRLLYAQMLATIASDLVPERPGPRTSLPKAPSQSLSLYDSAPPSHEGRSKKI